MPAIKDCQPDRTMDDRAIIERQGQVIRLLSERLISSTKTNRELCRVIADMQRKENYHTDQFCQHVSGIKIYLNEIKKFSGWAHRSLELAMEQLRENAGRIDFEHASAVLDLPAARNDKEVKG